ncbi:Mitogen-activated protein kinase 8 [Tolypocladium ophioglossoides CBS 100239]|uniref:Mitogen-activated protein kinase 8 n=1 Tax=Tolypocladium ophioglossoides (strain CBS 100239) TaxID=1163406 RepID=A0A0L0N5K9_TOLOC|nr:Mitogen-activated protein kinase 8 [Tolypocladium ophioglossoides CBS 100239]
MSSTSPPGEHFNVIETNEAFEEVDGTFQFTGTLVVYRAGNDVYHAISKARYSAPSEIRGEHRNYNLLIPVSAYSPPCRPEFTRAPDPLPCNTHWIKTPRLISYDRLHQGPQPNYIADSVLTEVEVCEVLKRNPHSNIARYLGCQVSDGRITGICFAKYSSTLMQTVNPGNCMKGKLRSVRCKGEDYSHLLKGVECGIRHLHSLGFVHNDINPSNIMLYNDTAVIIDFGSCRRQGESLEGVGRTYEWYDQDVEVATPQNDLNALDEIRAWLGDESKAFQFDE